MSANAPNNRNNSVLDSVHTALYDTSTTYLRCKVARDQRIRPVNLLPTNDQCHKKGFRTASHTQNRCTIEPQQMREEEETKRDAASIAIYRLSPRYIKAFETTITLNHYHVVGEKDFHWRQLEVQRHQGLYCRPRRWPQQGAVP